MLATIIPIVVFLVMVVAYLVTLPSHQKYSEKLKEAIARLSSQYVQAIADLYSEIKEDELSTNRTVNDILTEDEYLSASRRIADLIGTRDRLVNLHNQLETVNLSARYSIFALILYLFIGALPDSFNFQLHQYVVIGWWVGLFLLISLNVFFLFIIFRAERIFNMMVSDTLYKDHV